MYIHVDIDSLYIIDSYYMYILQPAHRFTHFTPLASGDRKVPVKRGR